MPPVIRFKDGDRIRARHKRTGQEFTGTLATPWRIYGVYMRLDNKDQDVLWLDFDDWALEAAPDEPEQVTPEVPEGLTFERYHESMLPMFAELARLADQAGYCGQYDMLAARVGAPSRDEVRRLIQGRYGVRRRISVPLTITVSYETTEAHLSDEDALDELRRRKFSTWGDIAAFVADSITRDGFAALPEGSGSIQSRNATFEPIDEEEE